MESHSPLQRQPVIWKRKKKEKKRGGRVQCVMPTFFGRAVDVEAEICLLIPCEMHLDTIYVN